MLVAILGGGQLGRMLALAGYPLGLSFRLLDPAPDACAGRVAPLVVGAYDDREALAHLLEGADVLTYEFENVPVETARAAAERVPVLPPPAALEVGQDRLAEKALFTEVGIPTPRFLPVDSPEDLRRALAEIGPPVVLKTRRLGYDGKGQAVVRSAGEAEEAFARVGAVPCIAESYVDFARELSILAVRGRDGEARAYPLVENHHREGILRVSLAPAPGLTPALQARAEGYARAVMERLGYVGVLAIELFQCGEELLGNELAPRVHNSGHWTIEGAETSQFENHLRAVCGLPLGSTRPVGRSAMVNLIGATWTPPRCSPCRGRTSTITGSGRGRGGSSATSRSARRTPPSSRSA
ncbi:MAG: N5-carboxyaminoimidazole ribonucleotide synthase [Actinomycetota bacterium]|nr:MAG: N5-carboxyaminoimidazole ribonucleotide synthase [Actinomycetota bacterium]